MICAFSFCQNDREMAIQLSRHIRCLGGVGQHDCFLFYPNDVDARDIIAELKECFLAVHIVTYAETLKGWPDGPNQCFTVACDEMLRHKEPWLWMEADCVPTRQSWLDDIAAEWRFCGKPILGVKINVIGLDGKPNGHHITGVAVYPHDLRTRCPSLGTLVESTRQYRQAGHCPPAFDCYIAPYAVPLCAESQTIVHYWKSFGFERRQDGEVYCKFKTEYGVSNRVNMDAALIHGAKDFSLLDICQIRLTDSIKTISITSPE